MINSIENSSYIATNNSLSNIIEKEDKNNTNNSFFNMLNENIERDNNDIDESLDNNSISKKDINETPKKVEKKEIESMPNEESVSEDNSTNINENIEKDNTKSLNTKEVEPKKKLVNKKLELLKEKLNSLINNNIEKIEKNDRVEKKVEFKSNNDKEIKKLVKLEDLKEELNNIDLEELSEDEKLELKELIVLIEKVEKETLKIEYNDLSDIDINEIVVDEKKTNIEEKRVEVKENNIVLEKNREDIKKEEPVLESVSINNTIESPILENSDNIENKFESNNNKIENNNSSLNNKISNDSELTIINMKDSLDSSNLKGYNHYNNVSKTHSAGNIVSDNILKFQDLMGKLVEKAQLALSNGKSEVLLSLNPEYLGKVNLKITMEGDNLLGKIFVDNAEIKDIFIKNLDTVVSSLNEIGINIEGFDIMLKQDTPNGDFENEFAFDRKITEEDEIYIEEVDTNIINNYIVAEQKLNLLI